MSKREVVGRYRGSVIGRAWSFFNPVLMLIVYTLVFSSVIKTRWVRSGEESKADFVIVLFVGMIVHGLFAECVNRAPILILGNVSYVKKFIFLLEILPVVAMGSTFFHAIVSLTVLLGAVLLFRSGISWTILSHFVIFPLLMDTLGLGLSRFWAST